MTAILIILAFFLGMAFKAGLDALDRHGRPAVTEWGESTALWSEVDWEWYGRRGRSLTDVPLDWPSRWGHDA